MAMDTAEIGVMKKLIEKARQKPLNFGLCLASKPQDTALFIDLNKASGMLAKRAKKSAGGSKIAYGTLQVSGKDITFNLEDKAPAGMLLNTREFLRANDLKLKVNVVEGEGEGNDGLPEPVGDPQLWKAVHKALSAKMDGSLSRLKNKSQLNAIWAAAQQKGIDEDYAAAVEIAAKAEALFEQGRNEFVSDMLKTSMARFDKVKTVLSSEDRNHLRGLAEAILQGAGKSALQDLEDKNKAFVAEINKRAKAAVVDIDQRASPLQERADERDAQFSEALKDLEKGTKDVAKEVSGMNRQVNEARETLKGVDKKKGNAQKKAEAKQKIMDRIERLLEDIRKKEIEVQAFNEDLKKRIAEARSLHDAVSQSDRVILANIKGHVDEVKNELKTVPFAAVKSQIEETIKGMGEAVAWQGEQVKRAEGGENTHGTGRHGAQTGIERQARRAATGAASDSEENESGITQFIKKWNGADIEWEVDALTGKRKVKTRTPVQKEVVREVARLVADKASSFATPVLEKAAVDKALSVMKGKDWTEYYVKGSRSWEELTTVAVVVEAPQALDIDGKSYTKSWGYSVKRKDVAQMAVASANLVLALFEKGDINEDEMLEQLGVGKLLDGKALKKIPFATVVLERANVNAQWKSKTHYPNRKEAAECIQISDVAGRRVRNAAGSESIAS